MNIGSLFVQLGVKGSANAIQSVASLGKGLRDVSIIANQSLSFLTKMYDATSGIVKENAALGNSLKVTSQELGVSTEALQRWQYASKLSGANANETEASFKGLQSALLNIRDNGVPEYFGYLFEQIKDVDSAFDSNRFLSGDLEYAMETIRKLAKGGTYDLARLNTALSSLGITEGFSAFLKTSDVDLSKISKSLIIDKKGVDSLDRAYQGLVKIEAVSQRIFADIAQQFDAKMINELVKVVEELGKATKELIIFARESGFFDAVKDAIKGTPKVIKGVAQGPGKTLSLGKDILAGKFSPSELANEVAKFGIQKTVNDLKKESMRWQNNEVLNKLREERGLAPIQQTNIFNVGDSAQTSDIVDAINGTNNDLVNTMQQIGTP